MAPIFSLYEVVAFPEPHAPAKIHPIPSIPIPTKAYNCQSFMFIFDGGGDDELNFY